MFAFYSYLNVRVPAFNNYTVHRPDGTTKLSLVPNWELFAAGLGRHICVVFFCSVNESHAALSMRRYWYEYREVGMECPMPPTGIAATCDWALMVITADVLVVKHIRLHLHVYRSRACMGI
jgi:hypothetical protein